MSVPCPVCGREYDITLFSFGRTIHCTCGSRVAAGAPRTRAWTEGDPRFIADFLRVLEPQTQVKFELTDAESAAVLKTDDAYTYVIMPLSRER